MYQQNIHSINIFNLETFKELLLVLINFNVCSCNDISRFIELETMKQWHTHEFCFSQIAYFVKKRAISNWNIVRDVHYRFIRSIPLPASFASNMFLYWAGVSSKCFFRFLSLQNRETMSCFRNFSCFHFNFIRQVVS